MIWNANTYSWYPPKMKHDYSYFEIAVVISSRDNCRLCKSHKPLGCKSILVAPRPTASWTSGPRNKGIDRIIWFTCFFQTSLFSQRLEVIAAKAFHNIENNRTKTWYRTQRLMVGSCAGKSQRTLQWRQNGRDGVSNHQPHDCLRNRRWKKTSKLRVTVLCEGNSPVTG